MNLKLKRTDFREDGIFGVLLDENGKQIAVTLEHAYDSGLGNGSYKAKLAPGHYECKRGMHRLHNLIPFETFEIIDNDPKTTGLLFHVGNYNKDSEGCVLLGRAYGGDPRMITNSRMAFGAFMALQIGKTKFMLTVED